MSSPAFDQVRALEEQYLFPTYARVPLLLERGKGVHVFASDGKRYLDFITGIGVNAMGHAHPKVLAALREQSKKIIHSSNVYYNEYQGRLAQRLTALSGMERAFFTVSGAEAAEGAIKVARSVGQNVTTAAERLSVHRHTVFYRLRQIGEICGRSLESPHDQLTLRLAVAIDVLHST